MLPMRRSVSGSVSNASFVQPENALLPISVRAENSSAVKPVQPASAISSSFVILDIKSNSVSETQAANADFPSVMSPADASVTFSSVPQYEKHSSGTDNVSKETLFKFSHAENAPGPTSVAEVISTDVIPGHTAKLRSPMLFTPDGILRSPAIPDEAYAYFPITFIFPAAGSERIPVQPKKA